MKDGQLYNDTIKTLSPREFDRLSEFIVCHCGIKMPPAKKIMLQARLQKRLRILRMSSFSQYCDFVLASKEGANEIVHMIDCVTTNKTDFFREPVHFQYMAETMLPDFITDAANARKTFTLWSAGCSSGEEAYTLAIILNEFALKHPGFNYSILATDISTRMLEKARLGIYDQSLVADIPTALRQHYFMRSKDRSKGLVRVVPDLRTRIFFQRVNLMDEPWVPEEMDAIFCRNVMIYFERATQYRLLARLCRFLKSEGHLFLGHSETVHGFDLPLVRISSTIYRKTT